jgi:hypothetical protein
VSAAAAVEVHASVYSLRLTAARRAGRVRANTLERLRAALLPEVMETEGERDLYVPEKMLRQAEAGKPFLRD